MLEDISQIESTPANNIGMWNGTNWNSLQNGTNGYVFSLAFDSNSNRLYVGGWFSQAGSTPNTSYIAMWDGINWNTLQNGIQNGVLVNALAFDSNSNQLYVGGWFSQAGSNPSTSNIAMWDGTNWNSLQNGINSQLLALAFDSNSNRLYVGGSFSQVGSTPSTSNIAMWDGTNWNSIQSNLFYDTSVIGFCISFDQTQINYLLD